MNEKKSPITWGEAGIILTIIAASVGATWTVGSVRARDIEHINAIRVQDIQRTQRLEVIVEGMQEQNKILGENQRSVLQTLEGVRQLLEVHLQDSTKSKP